jgi:HK97 gp10 family phage protein
VSATIEFDVTDPSVKTSLANLPEKMLAYAEEALLQQAHLIVGLAQVNAPVDTGSLRDSIRVERGGQGLKWRQIRVRMGGYVTNPETGRRVDYSKYQEFGTRYMLGRFFLTQAVEQVRPTIAEMIKTKVVQGIQ